MSSGQALRLITFLVVGTLHVAATASAQSIVTGAVTGTITDQTGSRVAGATATLQNAATADSETAISTASGIYDFSLLKPGFYTVTVVQDGFKRASSSVEVLLGQTTTADVQLQLGEAAATTVEVTGVAPLVQSQDANINTNFAFREVQNVPNPGSDLSYVAQTAP